MKLFRVIRFKLTQLRTAYRPYSVHNKAMLDFKLFFISNIHFSSTKISDSVQTWRKALASNIAILSFILIFFDMKNRWAISITIVYACSQVVTLPKFKML